MLLIHTTLLTEFTKQSRMLNHAHTDTKDNENKFNRITENVDETATPMPNSVGVLSVTRRRERNVGMAIRRRRLT